MKQIITLLSILLLVSSCGDSEGSKADSEVLPDDSAQLRIAVMPTLDCLPVFVANERGYFHQAGIDVSLFPYRAQMDCDTAIERGRVNAVVTDLVRAERMRDKGLALQYITSTEASWQLLSSRHARIRQLKQLDDKMLAMTRFSATHLLSDKAVDSAKLQTERVFRIQVNDLQVRMSMIEAGIMDAQLMPEPWATAARNKQAFLLLDSRSLDYRLGVVAFKDRAATGKQVSAFKKAYDMACDTINILGLQAFSELIVKKCGVSEETVDSLPDMRFAHSAAPREEDKALAIEWLKKQGAIDTKN
jgi:NitT/TauT family transport system substrate-binding protein